MDDTSIDLRDHRGRLIRAAISAVVGIVVTLGIFQLLDSVAAQTNEDPVAKSSAIVMAIAVWVFASLITLAVLTAVTRWLRRRAPT